MCRGFQNAESKFDLIPANYVVTDYMVRYDSHLTFSMRSNHCLSYRKVIQMVTKSTGIISTIAGTGYTGYSGDGGLAANATLSYPVGIDVDPNTSTLYE